MMNMLFKDLINSGKVVNYMDDILIFTKTLKEHQWLVHKVLWHLWDNNLYAKLEKCVFEAESIKFLELIISHNTLQMNSIKVEAS